MTGTILQVNISPGGVPKKPIPEGYASRLGLRGDAVAHPKFHGGPRQALLLIAHEMLDEVNALGYRLFAGALGENLTTQGLDYRQLRLGEHLIAGEAVLELTKLRVPCRTLDRYGPGVQKHLYDARVKAGDATSPNWGRGGFYAAVLREGVIKPGGIIRRADDVVTLLPGHAATAL